MTIYHFTVEETNLISIYKADTLTATLMGIAAALPDMDGDMRTIANSTGRKLAALTGPEFSARSFSPADDSDGE